MPAVGSTWVIVVHWVMRVDGVVAVRRGRHLSSLRSRARPPPLSFMSSRRGNLDATSNRVHRLLSSDSVKNDASPPLQEGERSNGNQPDRPDQGLSHTGNRGR